MQKTKIEWCRDKDGFPGYTANPVQGYCPNETCPLGDDCFARERYVRFKLDRRIYFDPMQLLPMPKEPSRIFVGSTMELFGEWIKDEWMQAVLVCAYANQKHTFIFLTKRPDGLAKWNPWPPNAWVGATACNSAMYLEALRRLQFVDAPVRFISFEPLLEPINCDLLAMHNGTPFDMSCLDLLIIGAKTGRHRLMPDPYDVKNIIEHAEALDVPIFLKDNLKWPEVRRDSPTVRIPGHDR